MVQSSPEHSRRPWGLAWRCSVWYITSGIEFCVTTDLLVYSLIVPVLPFQLEHLGYTGVSGLVGWLLFAYSSGIVLFTPPIAYLSEKYNARQIPLLCGQVALVGAQIMLMLAPTYWLMVIARLLQGLSSSVIWVAGLALICDTVPERSVGQQLGLAMSGLSLGFLVGPPVAGALFSRFGFHGPFIFGIVVTMVDLVGRLFIIERKDALRWGARPLSETRLAAPQSTQDGGTERIAVPSPLSLAPERRSPFYIAIGKLVTSSRAIAVCASTLMYGMILASQEPALPLHLQAIWKLNASKVGIVYIAAVVPTLFSSALAGWWIDKRGTALITIAALSFSLPWIVLLTINSSLAFFIVMFALENFGVSATVSALTAELASTTKILEGVGYAHVYGAFNMAYGVGSALGPIIGGQMYDHLDRGWMAICLFGTGLIVASMILTFAYFEDKPMLNRLVARIRRKREESGS
ncbi:MFS general substrate transporter [Wolfiporia cocos MD-104 SS10]|uniref:MFS general substrate transporter n=1 Tax=Wolfiporia cocos (strain MD-104) TaxID=742152 RepID=A0A2H3ITC8_WOLCO|nr:MFS general substrate transporter [Wolfiporia cocos MD-104 SS10]